MAEKHTTRRRYITGKLVQRPGDLMNAFLDSSTTLFCAVNDRGEYVVFNKACETLTGYSYEEMAGKSFFALIAPSEHQRLRDMWATRETRDTGEVLLAWVSKDGTLHQIRWYFARFDDSSGQPEFIACIGQDVTETLRVEMALRESEARFSSVFENTSAIMFLADPATARIVDANPAAARFYGYTLDDLRARHIWDITRESDQKAVLARIMQLAEGKGGRVEVKHFLSGGEIRDMEVYSCPIKMGSRVLLHSIMHDITERKRAEDALRLSESRFSAIFQSTSAMMFLTDPDTGKVVDANAACTAYYGWTVADLRSKFVWEINTLSREVSLQNLARLKASTSAHLESRHRLADGSMRDVEIYTSPITVGGRVLLHTIVHDISDRKRAEKALQHSEERYRTLIEEATEAICIADGEGRNIEANSRTCELFGYTREEITKVGIADTVPLEDRQLIGPRMAEMRKGIPQRWERVMLRKDGSRFPADISARFLSDGRLMAIIRDVSERKRSEAALRESEQRFRQLADAAPVFIWLADVEARRTYFSRGWMEFTGRALDDEIGEGWLEGVFAQDRQRVADQVADASLAHQDFSIEYRLRASDGEYRWVLDHGVARFSENGQFSGYIGSCLDITERRRAEDALRKSELEYRTIMEQAGDGIFIIGTDLRLMDANLRGCEMLNYSKAELGALALTDLLPPAHRPDVAQRLAQLENGEILRDERELLRKGGGRVVVEVNARKVGPGRILAIMRDATERKQAEQALRESQQRYQAFIAQSTEGVWRFEFAEPINLDLDIETQVDLAIYGGVLAECNDAMARMYGYGCAEEIIGLRISQMLDMSDPANRETFRTFAKARYRVTDLESHEIGRDGAHHYFLNNVIGITEGGKTVRIWGTQRDVTEQRKAALALTESEERFKRLASATEEAIIIHAEGRVIDANQRASEMSGYPAQELIGLDIRKLAAPESLPRVLAFISSGQEGTNEYVGMRKDGSTFPCELTSRRIKLSGRDVRVVAVRDITERKRSERALQESELRYKRLSGATAEAILIHEQGKVIDANQRLTDMTGYSPEELRNMNAFSLAAPQSRDAVIANVRAGVETPYEAVGLRKDGSTFPGEITARNLELGGKPVRVVAIRDITERKRAEEALQREAGIVRLMQRVAMAANESTSSEAAMRLVIDEICSYTGWPLGHAYRVDAARHDLYPIELWRLDQPDAHAEFKAMNMAARFGPGVGLPGAVLRDRRPYWIEDITQDAQFPGGRTKTGLGIASGFAFPVLVGREVVAVMEFGTDKRTPSDAQLLDIMANIGTQLGRVVERERASELLEARVAERTRQLEAANRELSQRAIELTAINTELESFSYSVSHDLRAPLRGIFGFSQALQEDFGSRLGSDGEAMLDRIKSASQRMGRLIDDLLGLSRVTRAEMVRETVDLSAMAREICAELRKLSPKRQIEINIQPAITAVGDPRLLRVLLQNLLDNAFKFTSRTEHARISFSCEETEHGTGYIVSDNGAGFDMQYAGKLFGAFQRLHSLKEFEGTGIGLATVQRIVHRHGGLVRAQGAPGKGASFQFTLGTQGAK